MREPGGRDLDAELSSALAALRPRPAPDFTARVARAITAVAQARRWQRARRALRLGALGVTLAAAAAVLVVALPLRSPASPPRWRVVGGGAGAPLAIGAPLAERTPLLLPPGAHVRLATAPPSAAFVDLFDGAAATAIGADLYLLRGRARLIGRAAATTTWARVIATAPDARIDLTLTLDEEPPMFGKAGYLALAATAGAALTITVVTGSASVEPAGHGAPLVLAAGQRAVVPAAGAPTVATTAIARTRPPHARTIAVAPPALDSVAGESAAEACPAPGTECESGDCAECVPAEELAPTERVTVDTAGSPSMGPAGAAVTIVEFTDFQCPYCELATATAHDLAGLYPDDVRVVVKNLPLPGHKHARIAARAALAAAPQGKYWEMHEMLFANQERLDGASLEAHAKAVGLDVARWKTAFADPALAEQVERDFQESQRIGIQGTPTFVINGRVVVRALPLDAFRKVVDEELARAKATKGR